MMRKPKNWKPLQGRWSQEAMSKAIACVKEGKLPIRKAALTYGVPKSTLHKRIVKGIINMPASRPPIFTEEEEARLHDHVLEMEKMGFGLTIDDVCRVAYEMAEEGGIAHRFNKEKKRAGYDWYRNFCSRHPDLTLRKPEALSAARASMLNPTVINNHFQKLGTLLTDTGLEDKPSQIYNADETGFSLVHIPSKVLAQKGKRTVQAKTSAERGENVTALICGNAAGHILPPFIIFKGQRLNPGLTLNAPPDTLFGVSRSSFIDTELFETWFEKLFLQQIPPVRPVLLILDGHSSHISLSTLKLARSNDIHMYCLPPHTTNHTQPLDKAVFKSMKSRYNQKCEQFMRDNPGKLITRYDFCGLFKSSYYSDPTMANIISGFRATGVYPFNPNAIKGEYLQQSSIETRLTFEANKTGDAPGPGPSSVSAAVTQEPTSVAPPTGSDSLDTTATGTTAATNTETTTGSDAETTSTPATLVSPAPITVTGDTPPATTATSFLAPSTSTSMCQDTPSTSGDRFSNSLQKPILQKRINTSKKSRRITEGRCMTSLEIITSLEKKKEEVDRQNALKETRKLEREERKKRQEEQKRQKLAAKSLKKGTKKSKPVAKVATQSVHDQDDANDPHNYCGHCNGYYYDDGSDDDDWWPCTGSCGLYWHESCTGIWQPSALEKFRCENCSQ